MGQQTSRYDLSLVLPSMNEGDGISLFLEELISKLDSLRFTYEVIAIDTPSSKPSFAKLNQYAERYDNFTAVQLADKRPAGSGKTVQYMIGYELAQGRYIIQMDTDGQDDPADIPLFLAKLDEGFDLVVGYKQNRKDGFFYNLQSKVGNYFTRFFTQISVHDMNCGFKAFRAPVAKSLTLNGRLYRFIPSLLHARGYKVTEVPINNRVRVGGKTNFSFVNRLKGGLFDLPLVSVLNVFSEVPIYLFGSITLFAYLVAVFMFLLAATRPFDTALLVLLLAGFSAIIIGSVSFIVGLAVELLRYGKRPSIESYGIASISGGRDETTR